MSGAPSADRPAPNPKESTSAQSAEKPIQQREPISERAKSLVNRFTGWVRKQNPNPDAALQEIAAFPVQRSEQNIQDKAPEMLRGVTPNNFTESVQIEGVEPKKILDKGVNTQTSEEQLPDLGAPINFEDIIYAPSLDLRKGLERNGLEPTPELETRIRAAKSLEELHQLGLSDDILRSIKEGVLVIKDEEIPIWMKERVQELIQFAVSNGAERAEGVGDKGGFYHVHIGIPQGVVFTGDRQAVWEKVQQTATLMLGHTQELESFDKSKRSIVLGLKEGEKPVILPTSNPEGTVQVTDPQITQAGFPETVDAGTLYFYDTPGKDRQFSTTLTVG